MGSPHSPDEWLLADSAWWGRWFGRCAVRVRDGVASEPVPEAPAGVPARAVEGTLLPGLRDAHVHCGLVDLRTVRARGISAADDLGGPADVLARLRDDPAAPRLRFAGAFLTAPGGYPSDRGWALPGSFREVGTAADARVAVREQQRIGASFIKIALHSGAGPLLAESVVDTVVTTAHDAGLPVVAHAEGEGTFGMALRHGVDRLAHTPWTEQLPDRALADAAERMVWISTLDIHGHGADTEARRTAIANLRAFAGYGGTVRYGTDLDNGPLPLGVNTREVAALLSAGLSPDEVLASMTDREAPPCWVAGGLEQDPDRFPDSLSTARVLG